MHTSTFQGENKKWIKSLDLFSIYHARFDHPPKREKNEKKRTELELAPPCGT